MFRRREYDSVYGHICDCECEHEREIDRLRREVRIRDRREKMEQAIKSYPESRKDIYDIIFETTKTYYLRYKDKELDHLINSISKADTYPHELLRFLFCKKDRSNSNDIGYNFCSVNLDPNVFPFFWVACARGDVDTVSIFLENDVMNYKDGGSNQGYNHPLIIAYSNKRLEVMKLLVKSEYVMKDTYTNNTVFKRAFYDDDIEIMRLLVGFSDINRYDLSNYGKYAIKKPSEESYIELVTLFYSDRKDTNNRSVDNFKKDIEFAVKNAYNLLYSTLDKFNNDNNDGEKIDAETQCAMFYASLFDQ